MLTTAASETMKLKDSTRCLLDHLHNVHPVVCYKCNVVQYGLLDRPADGYNRQIQTEADQR
jgi:hypothetical protein